MDRIDPDPVCIAHALDHDVDCLLVRPASAPVLRRWLAWLDRLQEMHEANPEDDIELSFSDPDVTFRTLPGTGMTNPTFEKVLQHVTRNFTAEWVRSDTLDSGSIGDPYQTREAARVVFARGGRDYGLYWEATALVSDSRRNLVSELVSEAQVIYGLLHYAEPDEMPALLERLSRLAPVRYLIAIELGVYFPGMEDDGRSIRPYVERHHLTPLLQHENREVRLRVISILESLDLASSVPAPRSGRAR